MEKQIEKDLIALKKRTDALNDKLDDLDRI
jgi:hypothetical protein